MAVFNNMLAICLKLHFVKFVFSEIVVFAFSNCYVDNGNPKS